MSSSPQAVLEIILGITPVPGLSAAFHVLKLIVSVVQQTTKSKARLLVLAQSAAQLLEALNTEFRASRLSQSACAKPLRDLYSLLSDIQRFVEDEQARPFFKAIWNPDVRMETIEMFYRRIGTVADAFQISALLNIQRMLRNDARAHKQDTESVNTRLKTMEETQRQLWQRLDSNNMPMSGGRKRQPVLIYGDPQYDNFMNSSPHPIIYNARVYPTAEHLFQALKYVEHRPDIAERIRTISKSGNKAYHYSMTQLKHQHPDWDRMRTAKMEIVHWHKFSQHRNLKQQLLATGDAELVHNTTNEFWGVGRDDKGKNELGKVLERVRRSLRGW